MGPRVPMPTAAVAALAARLSVQRSPSMALHTGHAPVAVVGEHPFRHHDLLSREASQRTPTHGEGAVGGPLPLSIPIAWARG